VHSVSPNDTEEVIRSAYLRACISSCHYLCMQKSAPVVIDPVVFEQAAIRAGLTRTVGGAPKVCQTKVARLLGVNQATVSRMLRGGAVSGPLIAAVVAKLPVTYDQVFRVRSAA